MFPTLDSCLVVFTQSFCTLGVLKAKITLWEKINWNMTQNQSFRFGHFCEQRHKNHYISKKINKLSFIFCEGQD
jgi:hypothetical protein